MSLKQTVYFMALVGAIAGLICWALQIWITDLGLIHDQTLSNILVPAIMGALIGGMTVGFSDHWSSERVVARWVLAGVALGALAGTVSGILYIPILTNVIQGNRSPLGALLGRPLTWMIAGGLIGLVTGLRWFGVNGLRSGTALIGGLVGGGIGGAVFSVLGAEDFFQALAFMISGMGI